MPRPIHRYETPNRVGAQERIRTMLIVEQALRRFPRFVATLQACGCLQIPLPDLLLALLQVQHERVRRMETDAAFLLELEETLILFRPQIQWRETAFRAQFDADCRSYAAYRTVVVFIYNPNRLLDSPVALETSLSGERASQTVRVIVAPR